MRAMGFSYVEIIVKKLAGKYFTKLLSAYAEVAKLNVQLLCHQNCSPLPVKKPHINYCVQLASFNGEQAGNLITIELSRSHMHRSIHSVECLFLFLYG